MTGTLAARCHGRVKLHRRRPAPPLDQFVNALWVFEGPQAILDEPGKERALPDGCVQFIVNLREDRHRLYDRQTRELRDTVDGCLVVGPQTEFSIIETTANARLAGVHFRPGGAYPFLTAPVDELRGMQLPLDTLWGKFAGDLRERLLEQQSVAAQFDTLEAALFACAKRALERHPAVQFAIQQIARGPSMSTIAAVTERTGFSARHFIELFRSEVGFTPKLFCRVRRFQHALRCIAAARPVSWTDVALDAGYFDQPHFIHDFRAFAGINPSTYRENRTAHVNHVRLEIQHRQAAST